jgi:hypothetical protein
MSLFEGGLMFHALVLATVLFLASPKAGDPALVGSWSLAGQNFVTFKADGTGKMEDDAFTWTSDGKTITVKGEDGETDQMTYSIQNGQLTMIAGGIPLVLTKGSKLGNKAAAAAAAQQSGEQAAPVDPPAKEPKVAAAGTGKAGGKDDLAKLLLSSAWCSFHYNKVSGSSSQTRYVYTADGQWAKKGRSETYSSGYGGTVSGQYDSGDAGQWKTEKNQLYLLSKDTGGQWFGPVPLTITKNSNGYPIITSNGTEYMMCQ